MSVKMLLNEINIWTGGLSRLPSLLWAVMIQSIDKQNRIKAEKKELIFCLSAWVETHLFWPLDQYLHDWLSWFITSYLDWITPLAFLDLQILNQYRKQACVCHSGRGWVNGQNRFMTEQLNWTELTCVGISDFKNSFIQSYKIFNLIKTEKWKHKK